MALQKTPISLTFGKGVQTKVDPFQIPMDSFALLHNSVFTTTNRLTKRNGYPIITRLPNLLQTNLTTLNDNLIATGSNLYAYSQDVDAWFNKGLVQPVQLSVQPLVRVSTSQTGPDAAITSNGLTCLAYMDNGNSYYQISDNTTGQQIISRTQLEATATNPRVFLLGIYFVITYMATVTATPTLRYVAIPIANITVPRPPVNISADVSAITDGYDGYVVNNTLYLAWSGSAATVDVAFLTANLAVSPTTSIPTSTSTLMSVTADASRVYVSYWDSVSNNGYTNSFNYSLSPIMTSTQFITTTVINELTSIVNNGQLIIFYENTNIVTELNSTRQDFISTVTVTPPVGVGPGTVGPTTVVVRSLGLASKPFFDNDTLYMMAVYGSATTSNEPTYFLIDSTGQIYMRLAYSNGFGYEPSQVLPTVTTIGTMHNVPYLIKDFLTTVNKTTNPGQPTNAIYSQTGINMAAFTINSSIQYSSEIAGALHLTGGQLWEFDGVKPVEEGFHVWPENQSVSTVATGGLITAQQYNYQFTYEWTDNAGNLQRSAPSIPITIVTTGAVSTNTLHVATLRLTDKIAPNPVRIVGYRWSTAQQIYYQFTSVTNPVINNPSVDFVTIVDTQSDSQILGNAILYTAGGVIENIAAPASVASALFNNRLWLVDAEDRNLLWYSKQVIENTPVEMSDLLTIYVAPTSGAQGSTGPVTALSAMDDKLIIFKKDAIYYINGTGPDNTGANSQYSDPIFITGTVGTDNPSSIVLMPNGIMFQSDKGIWLLGRDLSTSYIGAPVEVYNGITVKSAQAIPGTNQVRFVLDNSLTLMYDYFQGQWGTHSNIKAIAATLYQGAHTYLSSLGEVFQETQGIFKDGSTPVLMSLTTAWINLASLQGFERFYFGYLLGTYYTPFTLDTQLAYDYNPSPSQNITIRPDNATPVFGGNLVFGGGQPFGGPGNVFEARFFPSTQKCESFQVTIQEVYDPSLGVPPGQGLSISGLNLIVGMKRGFRTQKAARSFGRN